MTQSYSATVLADSPIRYYRLGESSGTTAVDLGSQAQNGTLQGGVTLGQSGVISYSNNGSMLFNGSNGYISLPTTGLPAGASQFSYEVWFKLSSASTGSMGLLSLGLRLTGKSVNIYTDSTNRINAEVFGVASTQGGPFISLNTPHHVVVTYDGTNLYFYYDGGLVWEAASVTPNITYGSCELGGLVQSDGSFTANYAGILDEVAFYSSALTKNQVKRHYTVGLSIYAKAVLADTPIRYYRLGDPGPWLDYEIGGAAHAGSSSLSNGTWTIQGGGSDIWGVFDQFHFVALSLVGDCTISGRVASESGGSDFAKTGLMVRQSSDPADIFYDLVLGKNHGVGTDTRTSYGGSATDPYESGGSTPAPPEYLKIQKSGTTLTSYTSSDGSSWTLVNTSTLSFADPFLVGMAVCAHDNTITVTGTFDHVNVTPTGTAIVDIGSQAQNGTLHGTIVAEQNALPSQETNGSMLFDGSSGYISLPTTGLPTGVSPWSMECWAMVVNFTGDYTAIASFGTQATREKADLAVMNNGRVAFTPDNDDFFTASSTLSQNVPSYLAVTFDGTTVTLYVNGVARATHAYSGGSALNIVAGGASIGCDITTTNFVNAGIDEVCFYSTCLSAARIAEHYNIGVQSTSAKLLVYTDAAHTSEVSHTTQNSTTLNNGGALGARSTLLTLASTSGWPSSGYLDIIDGTNGNESIPYYNLSGNTVTLAIPTQVAHANGVTVNQWYYQLAVGDQTNGIPNDGTNASPNGSTNVGAWYLYNAGYQIAQAVQVSTDNVAPSTSLGYTDTKVGTTSNSTGFATATTSTTIPPDDTLEFWVAENVPANQNPAGSNPQICALDLTYSSAGSFSQSLLIPAYIYPTASGWLQYATSGSPGEIMVANPSSGPGGSANSDYTTAINAARAAGIRVIGYVHTSYGPTNSGRLLADVEADIDAWYSFYTIDGIFIDEVLGNSGNLSYYTAIYTYIKAKNAQRNFVAFNPGVLPLESYTAIADTICLFENTYAGYQSNWTSTISPSWIRNYNPSKWCAIIYNIPDIPSLTTVQAATKAAGVGYLFLTDQNGYTSAPSTTFWSSELSQL